MKQKSIKHIIIYLLPLLIIFTAGLGLFLYNHPFEVDFEYVDSIEIDETQFNETVDSFPEYTWMTLIDHDLCPFWSEEYVNYQFNIDINELCPMDTEKYSYILTFGYELDEFYVCANAPGNEKYAGIIPKQFNGIAKFKDETQSNNIYVYKIKKLNVVNNEKFIAERDEKYQYLIG